MFNSPAQQPIQESIFLNVKRQLISLCEGHCHLSLDFQIFCLFGGNVPTCHDGLEINSLEGKSSFGRSVYVESSTLKLL